MVLLLIGTNGFATNYTVSTKTDLQSRMTAALPGDTVFVTNGTYNWGQINFRNTNATPVSAKIVLKAQTLSGVVFTGNTYLEFSGNGIVIDGFKFMNGSAGTNGVIRFRSSTSNLAHYSRVTNITIDNYNSTPADSENEWIGLYGTNNRVDHCTFINKNNARATIVVWYSSATYPNPSIATYHRIDSNYFNGRSYMGANGGETIRVGTSTTSRTDGFNIIEYNLFENCTQTEPEIISSKSDFNTYRYNTFRNSSGGITLRHGRYNDVYGNFFIVDNPAVTGAYGVRAIDKGHRIYNNYFEGLNGNASGGTSQLRAPINLMNGVSTDTTDESVAALYFPADSCIVAFNTIVNARGGGAIVLGGLTSGTPQINPKGIVLANNLVKMSTGTALYRNPSNTALTFSSEGNMYEAPSGLGTTATGWQSASLNFGTRTDRILPAPSLVQDAAVNSFFYQSLPGLFKDVQGQDRSGVYDVGADELNGEGIVIRYPLQSNEVGAGTSATLPVTLLQFFANKQGDAVLLNWMTALEINMQHFEVQHSTDNDFTTIATIAAQNNSIETAYSFTHTNIAAGKHFYRLKMMDKDGSFSYSPVRMVQLSKASSIRLYPNPATDKLTVEMNNIKAKEIRITNAEGSVVLMQPASSNSVHHLQLNGLPAGIYQLSVLENDTVHHLKFIKQ